MEKYVDNQPIDEIRFQRKYFISESIYLFDDTVKNNTRYSRLTASDEEIIGQQNYLIAMIL